MAAHLVRHVHAKTRKPVVDEAGRAPYHIECPNCGVISPARGLSKRAAELQAKGHRCPPPQ